MLISCTSCHSKYLVNSADLKPDGRTVQCANCGNQWYQESFVNEEEEVLTSSPPSTSANSQTEKKESNFLLEKYWNISPKQNRTFGCIGKAWIEKSRSRWFFDSISYILSIIAKAIIADVKLLEL